jgi:quercetin dioxygenase-like cupin family protein
MILSPNAENLRDLTLLLVGESDNEADPTRLRALLVQIRSDKTVKERYLAAEIGGRPRLSRFIRDRSVIPVSAEEISDRIRPVQARAIWTDREVTMLTRRGFASCAICAITGFIATEASAQGAPPSTSGLTRKLLTQMDGPSPGYVTMIMEVEIDANTTVARHTHPGIESSFLVEGSIELPVEGQPTRTYTAGEAFQVPPNTPHAGGKASPTKTKLLINYIVEKGKPLASPA